MRKAVFENMCSEILPSLIKVDNQLTKLSEIANINNRAFILEIENQLFHINRWFKNINLLNQLESQTDPVKTENVSISNLVSQFLNKTYRSVITKG